MKVLILHNDLRVYWKGRIAYLRQFLASHTITLYAIELFGKGSPYAFDPLDADNCLFPDKSYTELTKSEITEKLFEKLDEIQPDVIIGGSIVFFSGALGLRWCKLHGKKFIMFDDGKPSDIKRNAVVQYIKNAITAQADALWLPSKDYDAEYNGVFKDPWFFHGYNTIDNQLFKVNGEKRFHHKRIVSVARFVEIKNFENLLRAWRLVEKRNDTYTLSLIGSGPLHEHLVELTHELGLNRVELLGIIPNADIPKYLFEADAFVLASFAESWGLVVNEAMAAGLPVLLSRKINASVPLLTDGENGYSFNPHDIDEIASQLLKFINLDERTKKAMSDKSLQIINTMTYENMGVELLSVLKEMSRQKAKKAYFPGSVFIKYWSGGYNTSGWDK
jgi:glycosyltransferase involved in cell wall biosynthesis